MPLLTSPVQICNLALAKLGQAKAIASLTEVSAAAVACNANYGLVLDEVLGAFEWDFCRKYVTLSLVSTDPTTEWSYAYGYDQDWLRLRRILSGVRSPQETLDTRIPFQISPNAAGSGRLVYTNEVSAVGEVTQRVTTVEMFPSEFCLALAYRLAFEIGPTITAGDPKGLRMQAGQMYNSMLAKMAGIDNSEATERGTDGSFINARA